MGGGEVLDIAKKLLDIEASARELATRVQLGETSLFSLTHGLRELEDRLFRLAEEFYRNYVNVDREVESKFPLARALRVGPAAVSCASNVVRFLIKALMEHIAGRNIIEIMRPGNANIRVDSDVEFFLNHLEKYVGEVTGRRCRFRISDTVAGRLNDLAACIHRLAEFMLENMVEKVGKVYMSPDASPDAARVAVAWDRATEYLKSKNMYASFDYNALTAWVTGNKVYLRVGSAAGHRTVVDLGGGTIRYYDRDREVNEILGPVVAEAAGLRHRVLPDGVEWAGTTPEKARRAAAALALATSMDIRIRQWWGREEEERKARLLARKLVEMFAKD